jgi:hypothetical protein
LGDQINFSLGLARNVFELVGMRKRSVESCFWIRAPGSEKDRQIKCKKNKKKKTDELLYP